MEEISSDDSRQFLSRCTKIVGGPDSNLAVAQTFEYQSFCLFLFQCQTSLASLSQDFLAAEELPGVFGRLLQYRQKLVPAAFLLRQWGFPPLILPLSWLERWAMAGSGYLALLLTVSLQSLLHPAWGQGGWATFAAIKERRMGWLEFGEGIWHLCWLVVGTVACLLSDCSKEWIMPNN